MYVHYTVCTCAYIHQNIQHRILDTHVFPKCILVYLSYIFIQKCLDPHVFHCISKIFPINQYYITGWWFGTCSFSISYMGCHPLPIDFHSIIFQRGRAQPPTDHGYVK